MSCKFGSLIRNNDIGYYTILESVLCDIYLYIILLFTLNVVLNWCYQLLYYSIRMFLVFVLHSFSIGSFITLYTEICYVNMLYLVFIYGILGLGIMLYFILCFDLSIQLYVYVSFSITFMSTCIIPILSLYKYYSYYLYIHIYKKCSLVSITVVDLTSITMLLYYILFYDNYVLYHYSIAY